MPLTLRDQGYAVVSCHVERLLDDRVFARYRALAASRPSGFRIASLVRPPDPSETGGEEVWAERVRELARHGPVGHHTHWGGPTQARPTDRADAADRVRREAAAFAAAGVRAGYFSGGGWFIDREVAGAAADLGYVDTTATAYRPPYLDAGAPRAQVASPAWLRLDDGRRLLELPATHSVGMLLRAAAARALPEVVHVHLHDWDALELRRRLALRAGLAALALQRRPRDLDALAAAVRDAAPETAFAEAAAG